MSRQQIYNSPQSPHIRYAHTQQSNQQIYNEYGLATNHGQLKKSSQISDLIIFNGQAPQKQLLTNSTSKIQYAHNPPLPPKIIKSNSQKKLPIIYGNPREQTYGGAASPRGNRNSIEQHYRQGQDNLQSNSSEVFQYNQMFPQNMENQLDSNGFHTFKNLPAQEQAQTAHFLPPPDQNRQRQRQNSRGKDPRMQYLTLPDERPHSNYQPFQQIQSSSPRPQSKPGSPAIVFSGQQQIPLSPRNNYENNRINNNQNNSGVKLIQIPQDEYQKFIDHLPLCKKSQDQIVRLRQQNDQLGQKEKFYWEENMTLRDENKRLRDLVNHFQKREKELQKARQEHKETYERMIDGYREAAMQEMALLFERYKLELQKGK